MATGQNWAWAQHYVGTGSASCDRITTDAEGAIWMTGSFQGELILGDSLFQQTRQRDIYLAKVKKSGAVEWATRAGSSDDDEVKGLAVDADGNSYLAGTFWIEGIFDTITLRAELPGRAIFLAKYNAQGRIQWARSISGSGSKQLNDLALDAVGNIYLTGFFQELRVPGHSRTATGTRDAFVVKFDTTGTLHWVTQLGLMGQTRGVGLALDSEQNVLVCGTFDGKVDFLQDTVTANTFDNDVFIAKFSSEGELQWGRKAGGVLQDNTAGIITDAENNSYITGSFAGRMTLSDYLTIESIGFDENFYLLSYDPNGTPRWAKSIGSAATEQASAIAIDASSVIVSGYYLGRFTVDGLTIANSSDTFDGFVVGFDLQGQAQWLKAVPCTDVLLTTALTITAMGDIFAGGSFLGNAQFDTELLATDGSFDSFIAQLATAVTPIQEATVPAAFTLFPNPTPDKVFIQTSLSDFTIQVFDSFGRLVWTAENAKELSLAVLARGMYVVQLSRRGRAIERQFVVKID